MKKKIVLRIFRNQKMIQGVDNKLTPKRIQTMTSDIIVNETMLRPVIKTDSETLYIIISESLKRQRKSFVSLN